jgi:hypothetical protein
LKTDVLLLADIFENFRETCYNTYDLDPAYYYTAPGLSWDSMLKCTKIKLELLTDIDMIHFITNGIRGGLSQCSKRYACSNNKYMGELYDEEKESVYLTYVDANNLYGYAMSESLPYGGFKWLTENEIEKFDVQKSTLNEEKGYILEVDLDYPETLHSSHADFPFAIEKAIPDALNSKQKKLIGSVKPKTNYIIYYKNLVQCLHKGLILKKIHKILEFNSSKFLQKYINLNNDLRTKSE